MPYTEYPTVEGRVITREEFVALVTRRAVIDYDGHAHPMKGHKYDPTLAVYPSMVGTGRNEPSHTWPDKRMGDFPADATHVIWFKR